MSVSKKFWFASLFVLFSFSALFAQSGKVLMFVSYEDTYYSEYIVMKEALEASGYEVEVRSAGPDSASVYMLPDGTDIEETANSLSGSSYADFTSQYEAAFGQQWNQELNETPDYIPVDGLIQDVEDMDGYVALVIVGGTGAIDYRLDGSYSSQGEGERMISSDIVEAATLKLYNLALEALNRNMLIVAQCHGASIPVFWKIPQVVTEEGEAIASNTSVLEGEYATGFPEEETATVLTEFGVNYLPDTKVVISSPESTFQNPGVFNKIITTRDWYPQTVIHAAKTVKNMYDSRVQTDMPARVLIMHGGAIDPENCSAGNRNNDVPCNYGAGDNLPADYTTVEQLLKSDSGHDDYEFDVSDVNLTAGELPSGQEAILEYFRQFDVLIFFKHWSTGVTEELQNTIVDYVMGGGKVLGLHHGMYNDIDGPRNKDILANELFGAESAASTWSANLTNYNMLVTNHGHFITTYGVNYQESEQTPSLWSENLLPDGGNPSFSTYPAFSIFDEIYNNMSFVEGVEFGSGPGQITPILSNDLSPSGQVHTSGFVRVFSSNENESEGRVAYFEPGERRESFSVDHIYGQMIRNSVIWLADIQGWAGPVEDEDLKPGSFGIQGFYPNPFNPNGKVEFTLRQSGTVQVNLYNIMGQKVMEVHSGMMNSGKHLMNVDGTNLSSGIYLLQIRYMNQVQFLKISLIK